MHRLLLCIIIPLIGAVVLPGKAYALNCGFCLDHEIRDGDECGRFTDYRRNECMDEAHDAYQRCTRLCNERNRRRPDGDATQ